MSASFSVFAQDNLIKVKTKLHDEVLNIKVLLKNPMIGYQESKGIGFINGRIKSIDYITKITAKSDNRIIFNIETNPYLSKNPFIKFKIKKALISDKTELAVENNFATKNSKIFNIKNAKKEI